MGIRNRFGFQASDDFDIDAIIAEVNEREGRNPRFDRVIANDLMPITGRRIMPRAAAA